MVGRGYGTIGSSAKRMAMVRKKSRNRQAVRLAARRERVFSRGANQRVPRSGNATVRARRAATVHGLSSCKDALPTDLSKDKNSCEPQMKAVKRLCLRR